ncbi:MAG: hypothetical protein O6763_08700 [Gammaproteobacteria bacterium]|nr:hypothetical protein [Gammaproteobacteria bacterium]
MALAESLISVVVGFVLGRGSFSLDRRRRVKTHRGALRAEANMCVQRARNYIKGPVLSPVYRAPMEAHAVAFPELLRDGVFSEDDVTVIEEFYSQVGDFNRTLDFIHDARSQDSSRFTQETRRAKAKAQVVVDASEAALAAVSKGLKPLSKNL